MKLTTKYIVINAIVGALYVVLTLPFGTIALNPYVQFRPAEALCVLPALMPYTVIGLTIGCMISNLMSTFGLFDVLLGGAVTLIAGLLSAKVFTKVYLAPIPPVVLNALLLPVIWFIAGGQMSFVTWCLQALGLLVSQSVVCFGLGIPLYYATQKHVLPFINL